MAYTMIAFALLVVALFFKDEGIQTDTTSLTTQESEMRKNAPMIIMMII